MGLAVVHRGQVNQGAKARQPLFPAGHVGVPDRRSSGSGSCVNFSACAIGWGASGDQRSALLLASGHGQLFHPPLLVSEMKRGERYV